MGSPTYETGQRGSIILVIIGSSPGASVPILSPTLLLGELDGLFIVLPLEEDIWPYTLRQITAQVKTIVLQQRRLRKDHGFAAHRLNALPNILCVSTVSISSWRGLNILQEELGTKFLFQSFPCVHDALTLLDIQIF